MRGNRLFAPRPDPRETTELADAPAEEPRPEASPSDETLERARKRRFPTGRPSLDDMFRRPPIPEQELHERVFRKWPEPEKRRKRPPVHRVPPRPAPKGPWVRRGVAIALAGILVLAAAGLLMALAGRGDDANVVSVPRLAQVTLPDDWVDHRAVLPDFDGAGASGASPPGGLYPSALMIGRVTPSATSLLPDGVLRRLDKPPPAPRVHERSDGWVFSYSQMRVRRPAGRLTMHVMLTESGTAAVACFAGASDPTSFARRCEAAANTLRPAPGTRGLPGPSWEYAVDLDRTFASLGRSRAAARSSLDRPTTSARARAQARGLERDYTSAARAVRDLEVVRARPELTAVNERIATALEGTAEAYAGVATAASRRSRRGMPAARSVVVAREQALRQALRDLAGLGYRPTLVD